MTVFDFDTLDLLEDKSKECQNTLDIENGGTCENDLFIPKKTYQQFVGTWSYGKRQYEIKRIGEKLLFEGPHAGGKTVTGVLEPKGESQLETELVSNAGSSVGRIRLFCIAEDDVVLSNFKSSGRSEWGKDILAFRQGEVKGTWVASNEPLEPLPKLLKVPPEVVKGIASFVNRYRGTSMLTKISGERYEVFLSGKDSGHFRKYAEGHANRDVILGFLKCLERKLLIVAGRNRGTLSPDIVALVGAGDMQVPHVDLKPGQIQVIVALTKTTPTLVYDPTATKPSVEQAMQTIGVGKEHWGHIHMAPLVNGGTPLVLPVEQLYNSLVPACDEFNAGDAVQIRDGVVHAGPKCEEDPNEPRIVIFSTYTTQPVAHYRLEFQYKPWDWASFAEVPAKTAYLRLREVHEFAKKREIAIEPWVYYDGNFRTDACRHLCKTPDLSDQQILKFVTAWRRIPGKGGYPSDAGPVAYG